MKTTNLFLSLAMLFFSCASLHDQVTIGGLENPKAGAILDLNSTARGGLLLSNVTIADPELIPFDTNAFPGIDASNNDTNLALCGAMVYNTGEGTTVPAGVYIWNGYYWTPDGSCAPVITASYPSFVTLIIGNSTTLSVSARNCPPLSYEWFENTVASTSGGTSTGVTTADYTTLAYATAGTYYYYCTVSSSSNTSKVTSDLFTVRVMPTPQAGDVALGRFIAGETCFDVNAGGNSNAACGTTADREDATMDLSETYTYTFKHVTANKSLQFLLEDAVGAVELIGFSSGNGDLPSIPAGTPAIALGAINAALAGKPSFEAESTYSITLKFKNTLNQQGQTPTAYGTTNTNPVAVTLKAIYEDNASVIRQENRMISIKDCFCCGNNGLAGTFVSTTGNSYLTYEYPTGTANAGQCWMVSGSKEGNAQAQCYKNDCTGYPSKGYYYDRNNGHLNSSCPSGWHVPTDTEMYSLMGFLTSSAGISPYDLRQWWYGPTATENIIGLRDCNASWTYWSTATKLYYGTSNRYYSVTNSTAWDNWDGCSSSTTELNVLRCVWNY
jgi:uncharacterized protein (TIGR02145 family)